MAEDVERRSIVSRAVTYVGRGGPEVIEFRERSVPPPAAGEVRLKVSAAAVNPTDLGLRERGFGDPGALLVPGMDAAGTVESVGSGVAGLRPGQQVMAAVMPRRPQGGAQAEHIVVPAASVVPIPDGVSLAQAATLPMNGLTALRALELAGLEPGQLLAVSGGAGLLAHYAIAAAKRQGYRVVADASADEAGLVRSYGADIVVERGADFAGAIRRASPAGADALLDTALLGEGSFGALRDGGVYIPVRGWGDQPGERGISIKPVFVSDVLERTQWLELLRDMVHAGEITLRVAALYPPERVGEAQRTLAAGGVRGRPVVEFRPR